MAVGDSRSPCSVDREAAKGGVRLVSKCPRVMEVQSGKVVWGAG